MTIIKGYKDLPDICYCEYCGEEYGGGERDIKPIYKQVKDDIFTVTICYDYVILNLSGNTVRISMDVSHRLLYEELYQNQDTIISC